MMVMMTTTVMMEMVTWCDLVISMSCRCNYAVWMCILDDGAY